LLNKFWKWKGTGMPVPYNLFSMISVIILTYNRINQLIRCLDKLYGQRYDTFEVIVVDNGSTDKTIEILKTKSYPRLKIFENKEKANFSQARNIGIGLASGDIIAFTDDDCVPADNWLIQIDKDLREYEAVGGIVLPYKQLNYPQWWHPEMGWMVGFSVPGHYDERAGRICYPQSANLSIRKSVLEKERFQDIGINFRNGESVYYSGREDVELWRRLRIKGYKTYFDPKLIVYHDIPQERLDWDYLKRRAFIDGFTLYKREGKEEFVKIALNDLINFPFLAIMSLINEKGKKRGNIHFRYLWAIREIGVVKGYFDNTKLFKAISFAVKEVIKIIIGRIEGKLKITLRKSITFLYKQFFRRGLIRKFKNKLSQKKLTNILFIALGFLGDMVVILPSLKLIKKIYPNVHLTLVCYRNGYDLLNEEGIVDEIIVLNKATNENKKEWLKSSEGKINKRKYDVALVHYYHNPFPILLFKLNIDYLIGYDSDIGFKKKIWYDLLDEKIEKNYSINEIENHLNVLKRINIKDKPEKYQLHFSDEEKRKCEELLERYNLKNKRLIAIHIGGLMEYKKWEEGKWIDLVKLIEGLNQYTIIFISGLDEKENVDRIISKCNSTFMSHILRDKSRTTAINLCGETSARELCLLLKHCVLLITTDSGPKHLAFLTGCPTVTLYGRLSYLKWDAYWDNYKHIILKGYNLDLSYEESLELPENHYMNLITPEIVYNEVMKLI